MTKKNMIELLQEKESQLWLEKAIATNKYVKANFACGYGYVEAELTNYTINDNELNALLTAWSTVYELMESMGIETLHDSTASDINSDTWAYLNAKGEYEKKEEKEPEEEIEEKLSKIAENYLRDKYNEFELNKCYDSFTAWLHEHINTEFYIKNESSKMYAYLNVYEDCELEFTTTMCIAN